MKASRRVLLVIVAAIVGVLLAASPAAAHTGFDSSDPADGSVVDQVVSEIVLEFTGAAEPAGEGFVVLDADGLVRSPDLATADPEGLIWTLSFDPPLAVGPIGVRWKVKAPDAHPIEGSFSFTITTPSPEEQDIANLTDDGTVGGVDQSGDGTIVDDGADAAASAAPETNSANEPEIAGQSLEEFLTQTADTALFARWVRVFGRLVVLVGTILGIGGLTFAAAVIRGHRKDTLLVLKAVRYSGAIVVGGAIITFVAHLAVANGGWVSFWSSSAVESVALSAFGVATGLRLGAGVLLYVAAIVAATKSAITAPASKVEERFSVGPAGLNNVQVAPRENAPTASGVGGVQLSPGLVIAVVGLLLSSTFRGHTVTEGNRWITGAVDMVHVAAGSVWAGGVVAFAVVLWRRHQRHEPLGGLELAVRFSVIASVALTVAGIAGTALAVIILDTVSELWTTPWGQLLIAKFVAVAAAALLGSYNHFVVVPWMEEHPADDKRSLRLRKTVTGEATLLLVVITVTAFLVGAAS